MTRDAKEKFFEIDSKKIELEFLQRQFMVECKRFAAQCMEGRIRAAISCNPQRVFDLGKKGLKPVKEQMNQMIDQVSDSVDNHINRDDIWLHASETLTAASFPKDQYAVDGTTGPAILETAILALLSPAGELLLESGLDTGENWERAGGQVLYRHPVEWSREMCQCIEQYNERFNELADLVADYESLCEEGQGSDALDLWDSI